MDSHRLSTMCPEAAGCIEREQGQAERGRKLWWRWRQESGGLWFGSSVLPSIEWGVEVQIDVNVGIEVGPEEVDLDVEGEVSMWAL